MLHKWDSKLLLLSGIKHEGLKKVVDYYFYKKRNSKLNVQKKKSKVKGSYFLNELFQFGNQATFAKIEDDYLNREKILKFTNQIMEHKFNLLGSGWVSVNYDADSFPGYRGTVYKKSIKENFIDRGKLSIDYNPIRWNVDFVSGFEWPMNVYFKDIKFGGVYGADIKKPWELGRFYHLAQLSFAFNLTSNPRYLNEITNQFYDFSLQCPVYIGPQWGNAMEAGIRAINWVFCVDQVGLDNFSGEFVNDFAVFLKEHLDYILSELEWTTIARSNHYLANLSAIIVILSRIERTDELDNLYYWAASELNHEIEFQFHEDGGNYEGSTGYHRLSLELTLIALNVLTSHEPMLSKSYKKFSKKNKFSLPQFHDDKFKISKHRDLISKAVSFLTVLDIEPEQMIQVGDMDSGRVLKLSLLFDDGLVIENQLDTRPVLALVDSNFKGYTEAKAFKKTYKVNKFIFNNKVEEVDIDYFSGTEISLKSNKETYFWDSEFDLLHSVKFSSFNDFGLYIIESEKLFLSIRCGGNGQNGVGGHNHNDQLSINLKVNGIKLVEDPGSFIYTADPELRNKYRSVKSHFAPTIAQKEPSVLSENLFRLRSNYQSKCLYFDGVKFLGYHDAYGVRVYRYIEVNNYSVKVIDFTDDNRPLDRLNLVGDTFDTSVKFSTGYGELRK